MVSKIDEILNSPNYERFREELDGRFYGRKINAELMMEIVFCTTMWILENGYADTSRE